MAIHRLLTVFVLFSSCFVCAQKQFGMGAYSGFGLRKRSDLSLDYQRRIGWESGLQLQFRRKGGKTIHEWSGGLNGHYFDYTTHKNAATPTIPSGCTDWM